MRCERQDAFERWSGVLANPSKNDPGSGRMPETINVGYGAVTRDIP